jgi:nucleoside-diphosphate-sugar epimerase
VTPVALAAAVSSRNFDVVVDTTLYNGPDAEAAARIFEGRARRYIMLSTGQVYLVRVGLERPFAERDYAGPTIPAPVDSKFDFDNWSYGIHKRAAEDALTGARFPVTVLRLPMVNSERDHFHRIRNYLARIHDGGPILIPEGPHLSLRHVYGKDVVRAMMTVLESGADGAFNIGQDEAVTIEGFLDQLAGRNVEIVRRPAKLLWERRLMPNCSHFSEPWMSSLDNRLGKQVLGLEYTPLDSYLKALIRDFETNPTPPPGYEQRPAELSVI